MADMSDAKPGQETCGARSNLRSDRCCFFQCGGSPIEGGLVNGDLLPSPVATLHDTFGNIASGKMTRDFALTLVRVLYSIAIAIVFGVPVGILLGARAAIYRSVEFLIDFFRSTPATALFPLFLLLFGLGDVAKIAVACLCRMARYRVQRCLRCHECPANEGLGGPLDGGFVVADISQCHFLRDFAADVYWIAYGGIPCPRRHYRRRNVHWRDRRYGASHHRCSNILLADRHVRIDPGCGCNGIWTESCTPFS